jgi:lysophospholipid acyltransferase (LPLAT)-like uncharacterized protein
MRLSHPIAIHGVALLASWVLRGWLGSLSIRRQFDDPASNPRRPGQSRIFLFWHECLLLPTHCYAKDGVAALVSQHRDGELIAQVVRMLRGVSIRGSTTRGGAAALRRMIQQGRATQLAITPDGPQGPRRIVQPGAVYLAGRCAMPIVPLGVGFDRPWRAPSWDRMALPKPGSRAAMVFGAPIDVPAGGDREELARQAARVQSALDRVQARAESLAGQR